jgi:predicted DNA binding protein
LECPLSSPDDPAVWKFIARRTSDLRQIMARLSKEGVRTRIEDVSPLDQKATLTARQKEIMSTAMAKGYFDFPRKISLTGLSQLVGVKPSTLSEILRSAERRIMENAVDVMMPENRSRNQQPL